MEKFKKKKESEATKHIPIRSCHGDQTCGSEWRGVDGVNGRERKGEEEAGEEAERHGHGK